MRPIKGTTNHVFLGPHLGPQKIQQKVPNWSLRGAKMEVEIRKKREKLEAYGQDRSKGGFGTFCHGFGSVLGGFRTENCAKLDLK